MLFRAECCFARLCCGRDYRQPKHAPMDKPIMALERSNARNALSQDGLLHSQVILNGFYEIDGIAAADDVWFDQFVVHQQFSYHGHPKILSRHAPELPGCQRGLNNAARSPDFLHGRCCA